MKLFCYVDLHFLPGIILAVYLMLFTVSSGRIDDAFELQQFTMSQPFWFVFVLVVAQVVLVARLMFSDDLIKKFGLDKVLHHD